MPETRLATRAVRPHLRRSVTDQPLPAQHVPKGKWSGIVRANVLMEAVCAFHLAAYVDGPVRDRGGLMFVGPPGQLKTTFLEVLDNYPNALSASNLNTTTLTRLQGQFHTGSMRSLILPDVQAIYAGDPRTAARLEQALMQLAGEGNKGASWQDTRFQKFKSRCTIFGAMTSKHYEAWANKWEDSGFLRRFVWSMISLENTEILMNAIEQWQRAEVGGINIPPLPGNSSIPDTLTMIERRHIRGWLKHQPPPNEIRFGLLCRATAALRWHYKQRRLKLDAMDTMREFAETLQKDSAHVRI